MAAIKETNFSFPKQTNYYKGKVRDVYTINNQFMAMVVTDRISAFDVVLPEAIPFKGQVLNQIAAKFLAATKDIVPNWVIDVPDEMVTIGRICEPFKVEMVVRGYLAGHAWREYSAGRRSVCGVALPEELKENDKLPKPIITPTTKASVGHDEDISREDILAKGIVSLADYTLLEKYTYALYERGTQMAAERGLILVDTKYEFGKVGDDIYLIDEIHTPDSSRYFYAEGYSERQASNEPQKQLSKEFVRKWLIENGFQGKDGQVVPAMTKEIVDSISERYIELYEQITGDKFVKNDTADIPKRIETNVVSALSQLQA
ncbi:phosphoribosylaminoimidazolesuccinocarboxamide synthase [Pedobacter frigoris]|uniref:Phosphoribosylaminoimidazole-succinocarboxamide synthase n=1 Tax=Pedobacter frigoris TaxID=2571272 RepID=A0A4U1CMV0_9SPHI|nr:phosphoribosylaminoimidazolesuccinocarboxamide synthase [Pedobacter frigoris]TKC09227.1 phosphoribosylaminoimidazolesuccinocarboxamide synthase [Pedobacter frigoris]